LLGAEIDALADEIAADLKMQGFDGGAVGKAAGSGSLLTVSTDTPRGVVYLWIDLPPEPTTRARRSRMCLGRQTRARRVFPDARWDVRLQNHPIPWRAGEFQDDGG
jgi:hypothetical protein